MAEPAEPTASALDRRFELSARGTSARTEVLAGVTTFLTMAYIVLVNPAILGQAGMPVASVAAATCFAAAFASILMGLVSNTPLAHVLDHQSGDLLIFQMDLFPAEGPLPKEMTEVCSRQKDIQYSSRTRQVTDLYLRERREHEAIRALLDRLPADVAQFPEAQRLAGMIDEGAVNIVHLIYRSRAWESGARDFEFSRSTMLDHWAQGREAVAAVIEQGNQLIARNIVSGRSASFDLAPTGQIKEKQA